jgi:hypothetical protein
MGRRKGRTVRVMNIPRCQTPRPRKSPACRYCGGTKCWLHGHYFRKGVHSKRNRRTTVVVSVQRYLCRNPSCGRTFSVLPRGLLPICRFGFRDLVRVCKMLSAGATVYAVAKVCGIAQQPIARVRARLAEVHRWFTGLCRELTDGAGVSGLDHQARVIVARYGWQRFQHLWSRRFYPQRLWGKCTQHNSLVCRQASG